MKHTESITINFSDIRTEVKKNLSVIGKRLKDGQGASMFSQVTLSSLEVPTLDGYIHAAIHNVIANIRDFVENYFVNGGALVMNVVNARWTHMFKTNSGNTEHGFTEAFTSDVKGYLISYTVSEYLLPNFGQLAEKYVVDANRHLNNLVQMVYFKEPEEPSSKSYSSVKGTTAMFQDVN